MEDILVHCFPRNSSWDTLLSWTSPINFLYLSLVCKQLWSPDLLLRTASNNSSPNKSCAEILSHTRASFNLKSLTLFVSLHAFQSNKPFFQVTIGIQEEEIRMIAV
jgi:hypothetical protein